MGRPMECYLWSCKPLQKMDRPDCRAVPTHLMGTIHGAPRGKLCAILKVNNENTFLKRFQHSTLRNVIRLKCQCSYHRVTEWLGLEGSSGDRVVQPNC